MKLRSVGASLVLAGAMVIAPATAGAAREATAPLAYTCQVLGQTRTFTVSADTDAPTRLAFGQTVAATSTVSVTVPEDVTTTFRDDLKAATTNGPASVAARIGKLSTPWTLGFPATPLPPAGSLVLAASVPAGTFAGLKIGRTWRIRVGDLSTTLSFFRADGQPTSPIPSASITCTMAAGQKTLVDKITVVKDTTTTSVVGKNTADGERGRATVRVASTYGKRVRGEVRIKVLHRGELVSRRVVALEKGKAKLKLRRLEERGWSVIAKYTGSGHFRGSHGSDKIKVR